MLVDRVYEQSRPVMFSQSALFAFSVFRKSSEMDVAYAARKQPSTPGGAAHSTLSENQFCILHIALPNVCLPTCYACLVDQIDTAEVL